MPTVELIVHFSCTADVSFFSFPISSGSHCINSRNAVYHVPLFSYFELILTSCLINHLQIVWNVNSVSEIFIAPGVIFIRQL